MSLEPVSKKSRKASKVICNACGSDSTVRVHRTFFEKLICTFTLGKRASEKYYCKACDNYILKTHEQCVEEKPLFAKVAGAGAKNEGRD